MKKLLLVLLIGMISMAATFGQSKTIKKMQKTRSYEYYQANYRAEAIKTAKQNRREARKSRREAKKQERFVNRLNRINGNVKRKEVENG